MVDYVAFASITTLCPVHHHISAMEFGHLLTRSGLTYPEVHKLKIKRHVLFF